MNYTANSIIFFTKPIMKNATIGEKSMPPEFKGILFLIGPRIGSVKESNNIENWLRGSCGIQLRNTLINIKICNTSKTVLITNANKVLTSLKNFLIIHSCKFTPPDEK